MIKERLTAIRQGVITLLLLFYVIVVTLAIIGVIGFILYLISIYLIIKIT